LTSPQDLLDAPAVARRLGLSRVTVNASILAGELPATRLGQRWFVTEEALLAWAPHAPTPGPRAPLPSTARSMNAILGILADCEDATVAELAAQLGASRRTVLGHVQALDRRGLIERRHRSNDPKDPHRCRLTDAGREALGQLPATSSA
jgi:excisionase family DNA binding protein